MLARSNGERTRQFPFSLLPFQMVLNKHVRIPFLLVVLLKLSSDHSGHKRSSSWGRTYSFTSAVSRGCVVEDEDKNVKAGAQAALQVRCVERARGGNFCNRVIYNTVATQSLRLRRKASSSWWVFTDTIWASFAAF